MRRVLGPCLLVALALLWGQAPAAGQDFNLRAFNTSGTNVTLTTTSETVIVSSGPATTVRADSQVCVLAWAQLTTGTATTTVTPRLRRGTTTSGTEIGEANAITIGAAAGSNEQYYHLACEARNGIASAEYSLTLQQASASGNGTALQAGILVFLR